MAEIDQILAYVSVSRDALDVKCSDDHAIEIAQQITNWKSLAPFIGLTQIDEENITQDPSCVSNISLQRVKMIRRWMEKFGAQATYLNLIKGFLRIQRRDLIEKLCEIVKQGSVGRAEEPDQELIKLSDRPKMYHFLRLSQNGKNLRIMDTLSAKWETLALGLHFDLAVIEAVKESAHYQADKACHMLLQKWLEGKGRRPVTWETFVDGLLDADFNVLAEDLKTALEP